MSQYILQAAEGYQAEAGAQLLDGQEVEGGGGDVAPQAAVPGELVAPQAAVFGEHVAPQVIAPGGLVEPQVVAPGYGFLQGELARMKEAADMLHEQAAATKAEMRKGKIATSTATIKSAAGKRTVRSFLYLHVLYPVWQVKKLSEASHMLVDVDDLWVKLDREAVEAGSKVATHDNLDRINTSVLLFSVLFYI